MNTYFGLTDVAMHSLSDIGCVDCVVVWVLVVASLNQSSEFHEFDRVELELIDEIVVFEESQDHME